MNRVSEATERPSRSGLEAMPSTRCYPSYPAIVTQTSIVALGLLHLEGGGNACAGWWYISGKA